MNRTSWRRRKRKWWRVFASPKPMLVGAPFLVLPLALVFLMQDAPSRSPVEQAIEELPVAGGDASSVADAAPAPLGSRTADVPVNTTMQLYASSARQRSDHASQTTLKDIAFNADDIQYAVLHPAALSREDLMVGQLMLLFSTPLDPTLPDKIFQEFCSAKSEDSYYTVPLESLPVDASVVAAINRWGLTADVVAACPRLYYDSK